jgi:hypothetical protein
VFTQYTTIQPNTCLEYSSPHNSFLLLPNTRHEADLRPKMKADSISSDSVRNWVWQGFVTLHHVFTPIRRFSMAGRITGRRHCIFSLFLPQFSPPGQFSLPCLLSVSASIITRTIPKFLQPGGFPKTAIRIASNLEG